LEELFQLNIVFRDGMDIYKKAIFVQNAGLCLSRLKLSPLSLSQA